MADTTTRWALPFPEDGDTPDVPADIEALAQALDGVAMHSAGALADRPISTALSPGKAGRFYEATDATPRRVFLDYGTGWIELTNAATTVTPADGSVTVAKLGTDVAPYLAKVGQVIDWFRPHADEPIPDGFVVPTGQTLAPADHAFVSKAGQSVTLPDLRGAFVMGANPAAAVNAAGSNGDALGNAPGVGGAGGSNASKNLSHQHAIDNQVAHSHSIPNHTHNIDDQAAVGLTTSTEDNIHVHALTYKDKNVQGGGATTVSYITDGNVGIQSANHHHTATVPAHAHGGYTSGYDGSHTGGDPTVSGNGGAHNHGGATTGANLSATADMRPKYVGLIKLMRVK